MPGGKKKPVPEPESSEEESSFDEEDFDDEVEEEEFDLIEEMNAMDLATRRKVYALKGIQLEYNELMKEYRLELAALELAQAKARAADFERRRKIVNGEEEVTAEEVAAGKKEVSSGKVEEIPSSDDEDDKKKRKGVKVVAPKDAAKAGDDKGVPDFWLHALKHNELIGQQLTERDAEIMSFCSDISSTYMDDKPELGFILEFAFRENPFFSNKTLTKKCTWDQDRRGDEEQIEKLEGTKIEWLSPEQNPCVVVKEKKQRHKSGKGVRIVKKEEKCESFFHFFNPIQLNEEGEPIDVDEEDLDGVEEMISQDEDTTLVIQSSIVPRACYFYTGEPMAKAAEALRAAFGMGDDDGMDDEDDSDYEDEESEEEVEPKAAAKKGGRGGGAPKPGGKRGGHADPNQQDCKQQ